MPPTIRPARLPRHLSILMLAAILQTGCGDQTSPPSPTAATAHLEDGDDAALSAREPGSSVRWIRTAGTIFRSRLGGGPPPNAGRIEAYLSLAQYRAARVAARGRDLASPGTESMIAGAIAGASVVVLKEFYPLDGPVIDAELAGQRGESHRQHAFDHGLALGTTVGAEVLVRAATDNFGVAPPPPQPTGPGLWVSSGAPVVKAGFRARPFFLHAPSEINADPPPAFGSAEFLAALAEVRAFSDHRTPEQVAIVSKWLPFSGAIWNDIAADLIEKHHRGEFQATRIFALGNLAAFDAIIGCFETKFTYWLIRPTQADPGITLATGLPNHPSYPSAHSCETGAWQVVLDDVFPSERRFVNATAREASLSRVLGGLHYRFDGEAGLRLGRRAGRLALRRGLGR